jgi:hypothetical protein
MTNFSMKQRIADWHGVQAASFYSKWTRTKDDADLRDYCRHAAIADRMWVFLSKKRG